MELYERRRRVFALRLRSGCEGVYVAPRFADVTGDGHRDVLLPQFYAANHMCGTYRVIATVRGRTRQIFQRSLCETYVRPWRGGLRLDQSVWYGDRAQHLVLRWNGRRFVTRARRPPPSRR